VRRALLHALAERGYATSSAGAGMAGLEAALKERPDLVALDLGLPDVDGLQVLRMIRAVSSVPVIVATARDEESEIVRALGGGAAAYLVTPFGAAQLDARIRAVLRRAGEGGTRPARLRVGGLELDLSSRAVRLDGRPVELTPASSTCCGTWPNAPGRWSASGSCSPRCGTCRTGRPTRPSTSTCPGCGASSARPRRRRGTCTPCAGWAYGSPRRSRPRERGAGPGGGAGRRHHLGGPVGVPGTDRAAAAQRGRAAGDLGRDAASADHRRGR